MKNILSLSFLLLISSCGLKVTNEIDDNVLLGTWDLTRILCYQSSNSTTYVEDYNISSDGSLDISLEFVSSSIQYMVTTDPCSTSATGKYLAQFNGTGVGSVDLYEIVLGSTSTCDVSIPFTGNALPGGNGNVKLTMNSNFSRSLTWAISEDKSSVTLDFFTGYKGSTESVYCNENCNCKGTFTKR